MKTLLTLVFMGLFASASIAQATDGSTPAATDSVPEDPAAAITFDASEINADDFLWQNRLIVVFADTAADPRFTQQMDRLRADVPALIDRDVVIIIDSDREKGSDLRTRLRPRGFMFVWIDKDGGVKLRKPAPWTVREITRSIDKTPLRRQEVRDRRAAQQ